MERIGVQNLHSTIILADKDMMSTVDYRSSEEVISVMKEAMKNLEEEEKEEEDQEEEDHIQIESDDDADQCMAMDEESQATEAPTEERVGAGGDNSEQPQPAPPAQNRPPSHVQFFKKVLMIKGKCNPPLF